MAMGMQLLVSVLFFLLLFGLMAIGFIIKGRALRGSCGGVRGQEKESCDLCGGGSKPENCPEEKKEDKDESKEESPESKN